jgi:hypothetical protein
VNDALLGEVSAVLLSAMACSRRRRTLPRSTNPPHDTEGRLDSGIDNSHAA